MAQQFDCPKTETQLRSIQDTLYQQSKTAFDAGKRPAFRGLLELMSTETTIMTAIHNIKSNKGSETPGVDFKTIRKDYLQKPFDWVINDIQSAFQNYEAQKIAGNISTNLGKRKNVLWGFPLYGTASCRSV